MTLIDGKQTADDIKREIAAEVEEMVAQGKRRPHLAAILVGHDGGSETYVANKVKACEACGFRSTLIRYEDDVTEEKLLETISRLNEDPEVDGFIVQLPFPATSRNRKLSRRLTTARMSTDSIRSTWAACRSGCHASFQRLLPASWNS